MIQQQQDNRERTASERYQDQKQSDPAVNADRISQEARAVLERTNTVEESRAHANSAATGAVRDLRIDTTRGASAREVGDLAVGQAMVHVDRRLADLKVPVALDDTHFIRDEVRRGIMNAAIEVQAKEARVEQEQQQQRALERPTELEGRKELHDAKEPRGERALRGAKEGEEPRARESSQGPR